jgi:CHAT domain-containing protein
MHDAGPGVPERRSLLRLLALFVALAAGATLAFANCERVATAAESGNVAKLASIVGEHRLTRARLSGGFAYTRCQSDSAGDRLVHGLVCAGPPARSWKSAERLRKFAAYMRAAGQNGSAPADAHFAGIWDLVWGSTDAAVADLRDAVRREPANARAFNDLAVALTESAERHDDPSTLIDAFTAADSAVRQDSTLAEAQFTLAVLLEQLYLRTDAIGAWKRYLQLDPNSPWAAEARERVKALESPKDQWQQAQARLLQAAFTADSQTITSIVGEFPADTRTWIQQQLGAWGIAFAGGDTAKAREKLNPARALAGPLRAVTGDAMMTDAVAAIDRALAKNDVGRLRALAKGHAALAKSTEHGLNAPSMEAALTSAQRMLAEGASPMRDWALFQHAALAQLQTQRQDSALAWLTAIRDSAPKQYVALRSYAAQYQGMIYDIRSDFRHSLPAYDTALVESRTTGDPQITIRVGVWLAQIEAVLRGREAAWRTRYAMLAATPRYPTAYRSLYSAFDYAGRATADESPRLALRYCDETIRIARSLKDPASISYALRRRAEQLATMGQIERARADIVAALDAVRHIADTASRTKPMSDVMLAGAYVALRSAPAQAETTLRRVIDEYRAKKFDKGLPSAYLYLAQSQAAAGRIGQARVAFDSATSLMQRQRATIKDYAERGAFLDAARAVIDQIVAFHAGQSWKDAFEYFEGTRSRVLLEQLEERRGEFGDQPRDVLAALQRRLAKDDLVLSYAVLPRELLIWTIGKDRFEQHRVSVTAPALQEMVDRYRRSLVDGSADPDIDLSERLYQLLVESAGHVDHGSNIIVIPDRWLHFVPFVALRDSTGRYLVRDHAVSYAPSAILLTSNLARVRQRFTRSSKVLAIGNPAFDRRTFQLPYLPAADGEARRIASLYANEKLLTGRDATDAALERLAPAFDILHFAGHAVVGRDAPQLSHLVLASDGRSDGAVFSTEIAQWKLPRTRLVILSGCSTADGKLSATEGASSLARAFFAAGVPEVLSSLWDIDDDDTADFFIAFHSRLAEGVPPSVALRETQIKWLGDGSNPAHSVRSWAAFQIFGG